MIVITASDFFTDVNEIVLRFVIVFCSWSDILLSNMVP